jgi:hypothetical protein
LVPLGLGTAALIATDQQTGDEIAESDNLLHASRIISYAGSSYGTGAIAAGFYLIGRVTHNDRARETGLLAGEALIDSAIVATSIKAITQRTRPTGGRSRSDFFDGGSSFLRVIVFRPGLWPRSSPTSITINLRCRSRPTELPAPSVWLVSPAAITIFRTY